MRRLILVSMLLCAPATAAPLVAYDDSLQNGFEDWSWAQHSLTQTSPVHSGKHSISVEPDSWTALYLHLGAGIDLGTYDALDFWIHGGPSGGQKLTVALRIAGQDAGDAPLERFVSGGAVPAGHWAHVHVPFADLGVTSGVLDGFWFQDATGGDQPAV